MSWPILHPSIRVSGVHFILDSSTTAYKLVVNKQPHCYDLIFGQNEDHDADPHSMIKQSKGIKLNPDKCLMKKGSIKFDGIMCGPDGIKPDRNKVSVLGQMNPKKQVRVADVLRPCHFHGTVH